MPSVSTNGKVVVADGVCPPLRRGRGRGRRAGRRQHRLRPQPLHRDHGPLGLGQVDPDAHPRRARPPDLGHGRRSTARRSPASTTAALTQLRRDKLGFVFQFFNLLPVLTAEENLVLPLSIAGRKPDREWLDQLVRTVGLEDRRTHRPAELSGGQQQRVAVARALVSKPAVVFADEPTGNLDSKASADVLKLLRQAVDEFGQTVIMVTHDPAAAAHADRLITLRDGAVVHDAAPGSADDVIELMKKID